MDPLKSISQIAASGMLAQSARLQVVAENVANAAGSSTSEPILLPTACSILSTIEPSFPQ